MPGYGFLLRCPSCRAQHEVLTGGGTINAGTEVWTYVQHVCTRCATVVSVDHPTFAAARVEPTCTECASPLEPWTGTVSRMDENAADDHERVVGPCPRCGTVLDSDRDSDEISLWD